jgi:hypothetical protein
MGWGFLDDIVDTVSDGVDAVGDAVSDAAESAYDAVSQGAVGDAIAWAGRGVDTATFGLASTTLEAADDYVFDTVDYVTAGAVNIDFDDGQFTVGAGIDGVAHVGASVGEAGIGASGEALIGGGFDVSMTHDGFSASGSAGIDWGPLPYAEGHVQLAANGDVLVNGRVQGTLPTPYGIFSGQAQGGFASTDAGWGGYLDSQGSWTLPSGVTLAGGEHLAYQQTDDGSYLSVGVNGSVSYQGLGTVGGGVGYERVEQGGDVVEGVHLEGSVDALGMSAGASADYLHADVGGVERSDWSGDADVDGPSLEDGLRIAGALARSELGDGADADALDATDAVGDDLLGMAGDVGGDLLGIGEDTGDDLLGGDTVGDDALAGTSDSPGDDLLGSDMSGNDLLGGIDAGADARPPRMGADIDPGGTGPAGVGPGESGPAEIGASGTGPSGMGPADIDPGGMGPADSGSPDMGGSAMSADVADGVPPAAPADDFDSAIQTADSVEQSMDDITQDLG